MGAGVRLGVNGWRIHGQRTGVGRYLLNLVTRWDAEAVAGRFDEVTFYSHRALDRIDVPLPANIHERVLRPPARMVIWENLAFGPRADDDVLFCPSYSRPLRARGRTVVTIHDATSQLHPHLFGRAIGAYNRLYAWSGHRATLVITTTEAARNDIATCWGIAPSKIRVTPLAAAHFFQRVADEPLADSVRERFLGAPVPFFLFVGKTSGRRRVPLLLESFAEFKRSTGLPHRLLLVGSKPDPETDGVIARFDLGDHVRYSGFVSDEDLNLIYNAAHAVISPAIYEVLAFPILEAQATGAPVICVETPGSREITGGAAVFMPRLDLPSMADAMTRLATDDGLRRDLADRGLAHSSGYSWDRTARETLDVLTEASALPASSARGVR